MKRPAWLRRHLDRRRGIQRSTHEVASAQRRLDQVRSQWPAVHALADDISGIRERNHFREAFEASMQLRGSKKP